MQVFSSFKIGNMFGVKDPIPGGLRSRVVYKYALSGSNASYVGETVRHFSTRVKEHLASDRVSQIFRHLQNSEHCRSWCSADCFHVLDHASTSFQLKHGASLYIYIEAKVFSLPITNPNGRPMLPVDWLIHSSLILTRCHKLLKSDGCNLLFYFRSKGVVRHYLLGEVGPLNFGVELRFFFGGGGFFWARVLRFGTRTVFVFLVEFESCGS